MAGHKTRIADRYWFKGPMGGLLLAAGLMLFLVSCKPQAIPTVSGNNILSGTVNYTGALTTSKSITEVGVFNSPNFSQTSLISSQAVNGGSYSFSLPPGIYYLVALNNINGSGAYFDHSTYTYPSNGDPYTTYNNISNTANGVSFSWPVTTSGAAQPTAINLNGTSNANITFGDTYVGTGFNGQPSYTGSAIPLTGTLPVGIYVVAYTNSSCTTRTPANDWGCNPSSATNISVSTIEDEPVGTNLYVELFADSGNAMNPSNAGSCGGLLPCVQSGDPYTIVGPLATNTTAKPSSGILSGISFGDTYLHP